MRLSWAKSLSVNDHSTSYTPGQLPVMQGLFSFRRVSMAFERHQSAATSLTLCCPALSAPGLSDVAGQYRLLFGLWLASEPIMNWTCHRGTEPWLDTTHSQHGPSFPPYGASKGAARGQGQRPGWPLISRHVWTRPLTKRGPRQLIRIWKGMKGQEGSGLLQAVVGVYVCMYVVGMATWSVTARTTGPYLSLPHMCSSCPRSLCWGTGGRNYTMDDPVLLGRPAFQVGLTFVCWLWSYPPLSDASNGLIPLMSSYADHHIATKCRQSFEALCELMKGNMQNKEWKMRGDILVGCRNVSSPG